MSHQEEGRPLFSFFGPPGAGKGTLAHLLVQRCKYRMLSSGNLCREHIAQKTPLGMQLDYYLTQGQLIPPSLITELIASWLLLQSTGDKTPIILDGYPRAQEAALLFCRFLKSISQPFWFRVVFFEISAPEVMQRLVQRRVCDNKKCQVSYRNDEVLTTCKYCGSVLVRRDDDSEAVIANRLVSYFLHKDDLLAFYREQGIEVLRLSVAGIAPEVVFERFCGLLRMNVNEYDYSKKQSFY